MAKGNAGGSGRNSGSQAGNRKYGVVRQHSEAYVVRKMGVHDKNIIGTGSLNALLNRLAAGDILCVPTIASFAGSAYDLFCKMQFLSSRGVEFQSGNESYLNFSSVKPLSVVSVETLKIFAIQEVEFIKWIQASELPDAAKVPIINRIQAESLAAIALVFKNNGIKKKGN
ncbi:MAG: hypothetical protein NC302_06205 [Bacteroidales bacterium]|nr:hypothetical protein [Bacteroidales bacterium]MCM1415873.1 hypothetical protein [bacterium]